MSKYRSPPRYDQGHVATTAQWRIEKALRVVTRDSTKGCTISGSYKVYVVFTTYTVATPLLPGRNFTHHRLYKRGPESGSVLSEAILWKRKLTRIPLEAGICVTHHPVNSLILLPLNLRAVMSGHIGTFDSTNEFCWVADDYCVFLNILHHFELAG